MSGRLRTPFPRFVARLLIALTVTSNCTHNVTVRIHTLNIYPSMTPSRVERTINSEIGATSTFYCDGKRQGCEVEMVGFYGK